MATNRNKSGSGLRILWIPGKRKQNQKGFRASNQGQKKIEPWSMGGSRGQSELLKSEIPGHTEMASSSVVNCLPQTIGINVAASSVSCSTASKPLENGEEGGSHSPTSQSNLPNGLPSGDGQTEGSPSAPSPPPEKARVSPINSSRFEPLKNIDEEEEEEGMDKEHEGNIEDTPTDDNSNTQTLLLKDRKMTKNAASDPDNVHLMDPTVALPLNGKGDVADGVAHLNALNRKRNREKKYRDMERKDSELNERAVDCLYMGLMCCECSIQ